MSLAENNPFWLGVDGVLVINLEDRPERWAQILEESRSLIPPGKLVRIPAVRGVQLPGFGARPWFRGRKRDTTWAARAGCTLSHRRAIQHARDAGWKTVLILEDDVLLGPDFASQTAKLATSLRSHDADWDVCYLGFTDAVAPLRRLDQFDESYGLHQVYGCNTAHAYLLRSGTFSWLLEQLPKTETVWTWLSINRAVDRWYYRNLSRHFKVLLISPSLVHQRAGFSDIAGRETSYFADSGHHTSVASNPQNLPSFQLKIRLRRLYFMLAHFQDRLRGLHKRRHGF